MNRYTIYDKDGNERVVLWSADVSENVGEYAEPQLEYHGTWMGECFVTLTVKCAVPVDFHIGDYIVYRGEKFVINYDPTVVKRARKGTYGEGFTYDSIKLNALHNELTEVMFLDYVLGDNGLNYTSLPVFPFFAATIDDFCDRLQANTNRYCEKNGIAADDRWLFLTPTLDRTIQRALSCGMSNAEAMRRWEEAYGSGTSTDEIKTDVSVSISNQTIWNAMTMIKNNFGLNFINRGRSVIIGSAGLPTNHIFEYGKGNGLYEIERVADSEQQIVTKLYAYGNETNLPVRYYANIGVRCYARPTRMTFGSLTYYFLDMAWNEKLYCVEESYAGIDGYRVVVSNASGQTSVAYVADPSGLSNISDGTKLDDLTVIVFANSDFEVPLNGQELNFDSGINKDQWPASHREYPENLPNNMAVNRLMLPGFPFKSLYEWVKEHGGTDCDDVTGKATWHGYTAYFSKDKYQPYVQSLNSDELGIREYAKTFDGSDGDEDIFPTIEGTGFDTILSAEKIDDNGIFAEGDDAPTLTLTLPSFGTGFDLKEQAGHGDSPAIVMKDGYCGGRSFSFESANVKKNTNGTFTVKCKREHDDLLDLWFPYSYNKSKGQPSSADEPYQVCAGDKYVLTGIPMTDTYVESNAVKLLEASLLWLSKNDYTRHTYLPKVDEIYMARQHDMYLCGKNARSLYLTIKEGDLLRFIDEDLHIGDSMIFIDSLTIKEYGNAQIPTYDITLRNDKEVGTIERMQEQINSLAVGSSSRSGGSGSGGGGVYIITTTSTTPSSDSNVYSAARSDKQFLRRDRADTAYGQITHEQRPIHKQGAQFGEQFIPGLVGRGGAIDGNGNGEMRSLKLWEWLDVPEFRYNRITIYTGIRWDTFGGGIIESITPDAQGGEYGSGKLKLEDGEIGAIAVGDLCMGIWHDQSGNANANTDDNRGNFTFAGFKTVYFMITGVSGANNQNFTYLLRGLLEGGNGIHPFVGMSFAGRGNDRNTQRQAFTYTTTEYSLSLTGVNTWEFQPLNYYEIRGHIEGFSMPAVDASGHAYTKVFHGYGQVFGNAYIFGQLDTFERIGYRMSIDQSLGGSLAPGETEDVTCTIFNGYGVNVTDQFTHYAVTRNTGDSASDAVWNAQHTNVSNPFKISFSDLGLDGLHKIMATFHVTATDETTDNTATGSADYFS